MLLQIGFALFGLGIGGTYWCVCNLSKSKFSTMNGLTDARADIYRYVDTFSEAHACNVHVRHFLDWLASAQSSAGMVLGLRRPEKLDCCYLEFNLFLPWISLYQGDTGAAALELVQPSLIAITAHGFMGASPSARVSHPLYFLCVKDALHSEEFMLGPTTPLTLIDVQSG